MTSYFKFLKDVDSHILEMKKNINSDELDQYLPTSYTDILVSTSIVSTNIMQLGFIKKTVYDFIYILSANLNVKILLFVEQLNEYESKCVEFLNNNFENRVTVVFGHTHDTLNKYRAEYPKYTFDFCIINDKNFYLDVNIDFFLSKNMSYTGSKILFSHTAEQKSLWDGYVRDNFVKNICYDGLENFSFGKFS
jgi:hypothetical protein